MNAYVYFDEFESSLIYFCKKWYESDSFWDTVDNIYKEVYGYDTVDYDGVYSMFRGVWMKIFLASSPNEQDQILRDYDKYSEMCHSGHVWGGIANHIFPSKDTTFNYTELVKARIASMASCISHTHAKWLKCKPLVESNSLKLKKHIPQGEIDEIGKRGMSR